MGRTVRLCYMGLFSGQKIGKYRCAIHNISGILKTNGRKLGRLSTILLGDQGGEGEKSKKHGTRTDIFSFL